MTYGLPPAPYGQVYPEPAYMAYEAGVAFQQEETAFRPTPTAAQLWEGCAGFEECADSDCGLYRYHDGPHVPDDEPL